MSDEIRTENNEQQGVSRRSFISMLGLVGGMGLAYHGMTALGLAAPSPANPLPKLEGRGDGKKVLILGAGLAGLAAAYELRKVGYDVQILEYQNRAGGRAWTLRGGDTYTELGGYTQRVTFQNGNYFNPGPWRIPYHHHAYMDYSRQLGVQLESFIQTNMNAFIHRQNARPDRMRIREVQADWFGHVAELLNKATSQGALNDALNADDREKLMSAMESWGVLNKDGKYVTSMATSDRRGYSVDPADRLQAGSPSQVRSLGDMLKHGFWEDAWTGLSYSYQGTIFQPMGGMDALPKAFVRNLPQGLITYGAQVNSLTATANGVSASYTDLTSGQQRQVQADYCIATIPASIMSQMRIQVDRELETALRQVPYAPSFKAGIESTRRFWEEDDRIYGGISYTDTPLQLIQYPMGEINRSKTGGVLLAAYQFSSLATKYSGMTPEKRMSLVRQDLAKIHPQIKDTYRSSVSVGWHRVPWTLGCYGMYTDEGRKTTYEVLSRRHGRVMLAGEHISYWNGWQEGALLSAISAVKEIHKAAQGGA